jgi:NAD-dependent dihydropyrimidine dehydrogenase PreA subunit
MRILFLFESCTGNTEFGVEVMRRALQDKGHDCTVMRYREIRPDEVGDHDLYCFATPIMSFAPLASVWRFIKEMPPLEGSPAFVFFSSGGVAGPSHKLIARELRKHGMVVLGSRLLVCPDSFPVTRGLYKGIYRGLPMLHSLRKLAGFAVEMADKAQLHRQGIVVKVPRYLLLPNPIFPLTLFALRGELYRWLGERTADNQACNKCGICREVCPVSAVRLDPFPTFSTSCIGCWACLNNCPNSAILSTAAKPENYYGGLKDKDVKLRKMGLY